MLFSENINGIYKRLEEERSDSYLKVMSIIFIKGGFMGSDEMDRRRFLKVAAGGAASALLAFLPGCGGEDGHVPITDRRQLAALSEALSKEGKREHFGFTTWIGQLPFQGNLPDEHFYSVFNSHPEYVHEFVLDQYGRYLEGEVREIIEEEYLVNMPSDSRGTVIPVPRGCIDRDKQALVCFIDTDTYRTPEVRDHTTLAKQAARNILENLRFSYWIIDAGTKESGRTSSHAPALKDGVGTMLLSVSGACPDDNQTVLWYGDDVYQGVLGKELRDFLLQHTQRKFNRGELLGMTLYEPGGELQDNLSQRVGDIFEKYGGGDTIRLPLRSQGIGMGKDGRYHVNCQTYGRRDFRIWFTAKDLKLQVLEPY
jgi:hypothetical protein